MARNFPINIITRFINDKWLYESMRLQGDLNLWFPASVLQCSANWAMKTQRTYINTLGTVQFF